MSDISFFEAVMLICFGLAWPLNIIKSLRTKSTQGKSVLFLIVILIGYVAGITHKLLYSRNIALLHQFCHGERGYFPVFPLSPQGTPGRGKAGQRCTRRMSHSFSERNFTHTWKELSFSILAGSITS